MVVLDHVAYYDISEIMRYQGNTLSENEIAAVLQDNPTYGRKIDGRWYSYDLAIRRMNTPVIQEQFLAGVQGYDFSGLRFNGRLLDVGAGGEGIIGQVAGDQAVGIAPAEHRQGLQDAPGCGLKILMDARDMQFLKDTFDTVTAFYTLMYIDPAHHRQVFSEIFRVLKPSGEFFLWDMVIPEQTLPGKAIYIQGIEVQLKDRKVLTGYGALWQGRRQNTDGFRSLAEAVGFLVTEEHCNDLAVYLKCVKS